MEGDFYDSDNDDNEDNNDDNVEWRGVISAIMVMMTTRTATMTMTTTTITTTRKTMTTNKSERKDHFPCFLHDTDVSVRNVQTHSIFND